MMQPQLVNPLLAMGTPCRLALSVVFNADDGEYGNFDVERRLIWPGIPTREQGFVETEATLRPDSYEIDKISFDADDPDGQLLTVWLKTIDVSKWLRAWNERFPAPKQMPMTRDTCIGVIHDFLNGDWTLFTHQLRWWAAGLEEHERETAKVFHIDDDGLVCDGHDMNAPCGNFDEEFDDDDDDDDFDED